MAIKVVLGVIIPHLNSAYHWIIGGIHLKDVISKMKTARQKKSHCIILPLGDKLVLKVLVFGSLGFEK